MFGVSQSSGRAKSTSVDVCEVGSEVRKLLGIKLRNWTDQDMGLAVWHGRCGATHRTRRNDVLVMAMRAPDEVVARRRQKARDKAAKKGRQSAVRPFATCAWTVFLTACPNERLSCEEVVVQYRQRWQVELLLKLCRVASPRPHHLLFDHGSDDSVRPLVQRSLRITAIVIQHRPLLATVWNDPRLSLTEVTRLMVAEANPSAATVRREPPAADRRRS